MAFLTPTLTRPAALGRSLALALGGAALITLGAKIQIPFWPVPMTLHTLAVFFLAATLGPRLGFAAMAAYLAGYLLGAGLTGWLAQGRGLIGRFLAMLAGLAVVYALGLAWLALYVPAQGLLAAGLTPFLLGDLVKLALASGLIAAIARLRTRAQ